MKRARDVRDQLEGLMERVEIELTSTLHDSIAIRKVCIYYYYYSVSLCLKLCSAYSLLLL